MSEPVPDSLHAAVLAAGPSTRFGTPKQLVRISGAPVLHQALAAAAAVAGLSVTAIIGAHAREVAASIRESTASVVVNRHWQEGLASSIRLAVETTPASAEALLLLLADQVALTAEDLRRLHATWRRQPSLIVTALHGGGAGLPTIFPRWAFADLLRLRGDCDPRLVIRRHVDRSLRLPMPNAAVDLDIPEDLLLLERGSAPPSSL